MKWAKLMADPDVSALSTDDVAKSFKLFGSMLKAKKAGTMMGTPPLGSKGSAGDPFEVWKSYPLKTSMGLRARKDYELFCGGWLEFYDREVRKKKSDHTIYFEWDKKATKVTIWISPAAKKRNDQYIKYLTASTDPPSPPPPPPPPKSS